MAALATEQSAAADGAVDDLDEEAPEESAQAGPSSAGQTPVSLPRACGFPHPNILQRQRSEVLHPVKHYVGMNQPSGARTISQLCQVSWQVLDSVTTCNVVYVEYGITEDYQVAKDLHSVRQMTSVAGRSQRRRERCCMP